MEFVTHIIAAEEEECAAVGESNCPLDEWSGIEAPGLDTMKLAMLHCILTGDSLQMALDLYEPIYVAESETVILRIADECLDKLAGLEDSALEEIAGELAATEEYENDSRDADDLLAHLIELTELAQLADSQGQVLLVWMSLAQG